MASDMGVQISANGDDDAPAHNRRRRLLTKGTKYAGAGGGVILVPTIDDMRKSSLVAVEGLRPRQVLAASLLVQGRRGKDVAAALGVSAETVSRWRQCPEFQALMHKLLQETIDTARLGIVSLCAESIEHLRGLLRSFDDATSLKAITLILGKVAPVLGVIRRNCVGHRIQRPSERPPLLLLTFTTYPQQALRPA